MFKSVCNENLYMPGGSHTKSCLTEICAVKSRDELLSAPVSTFYSRFYLKEIVQIT